MLRHYKIFRELHPKRERNGKNMGRTGQDRPPPMFCPSWERALRGIRNGDVPFQHPSLYIRNGRRIRFCDKMRCAHFHDGRRNRRRARFCDKRSHAPSNMCLLYLHNQRRAIGTCGSLLLEKRACLRY
jgi:hypothetical protein